MQIKDFEGLFRTMDNLPVIIRYLDPPLHEFLPKTEEEIKELANDLNTTIKNVKNHIQE